MRKKAVIIGAGIAGLSTGCYLQMNDYDTEIFELHSLPGGLCTSWKRKDFVIDGCIEWLVGSGPGNKLNQMWNELIDMQSIDFVEHQEYRRFEDDKGNRIQVFADTDMLKRELLTKAPEDKELIEEFICAIKKFSNLNLPLDQAPEVISLWGKLKLMLQLTPYLSGLKKWIAISIKDYSKRFKNPLLQQAMSSLFMEDMPVLFIIMMLAWMNQRSAGYPIGGSLKFAQQIEDSYVKLGGKINYNARVAKIVTKDDLAVGIMADEKQYQADLVISAADGYDTIFNMLDGNYLNSEIENYYNNYETFPSYLQVSLGVARTFADAAHLLTFSLAQSLVIDEQNDCNKITVKIANFDSTLAPAGKTVISVMLPTTNYQYWTKLKADNIDKYRAEKQRISEAVINILDAKYGYIKGKIEMIDVATPATVIRYTNNWHGSWEGWMLTPEIGFKQMSKTLPGLKNFYMAGQWVEPGGGLPNALKSGRHVAQIICKEDGKSFVVPGFAFLNLD